MIPNKPDHSKSQRLTQQRSAVLHAVEMVRTHPSAEEVFHLVRKELPNISLATVYRNLHLLAEEGKIREVQFEGDVLRYDGITGPHEHFYCRSCRTVWDIDRSLSPQAIHDVERSMKASVESYNLDFYGLCSVCRRKA